MILSKIKKHLSIILVRLNQKRELERIDKENNNILDIVRDSFLEIKLNLDMFQYNEAFNKSEAYRKLLLKDNRLISYEIFGLSEKKLVKDICKKASFNSIWAKLLFLIIKKINSPHVLEIGTNLGVSGSYILNALKDKKDSRFVTMEGVPGLCKIASNHFSSIAPSKKYEVRQGLYESVFPDIINEKKSFNIFFIDGNHTKEDTLIYFNSLKRISKIPSIMIFDDINWSLGMKDVWSIIKKDENISFSVDFFKLGIIIIDRSKFKKPSHFKLHLSY